VDVLLLNAVLTEGSGYMSACIASHLKSDSSVICNMTVMHDECAVDCTSNVLNLNLNASI